MRALVWLVAAALSVAGGSLLLRRRERRSAQSFLDALQDGAIDGFTSDDAISRPGHRAEIFRGIIAGQRFCFAAETDASSTRWSFALIWEGERFDESWNARSGFPDEPLRLAYLFLRRRASPSPGPN